MVRLHRDEAQISRLRHAAEDAKNVNKGRRGGGIDSRTDTAVDQSMQKRIGRSGGHVSLGLALIIQIFACRVLSFVLLRPCSRYVSFLNTGAPRLAARMNSRRHLYSVSIKIFLFHRFFFFFRSC